MEQMIWASRQIFADEWGGFTHGLARPVLFITKAFLEYHTISFAKATEAGKLGIRICGDLDSINFARFHEISAGLILRIPTEGNRKS